MTEPAATSGGSGSALTSSTTLRFIVLVVTMIVAAMNVGIVWRRFSPPFYQHDKPCEQAFYRLVFENLATLRAGGVVPTDDAQHVLRAFLDAQLTLSSRMPRCFEVPHSLPERLDLVFPALLLGSAGVLYLLTPYWRILGRRLIRLDRAGQPEVCREVDRLIAVSGVRIRRVWLDPADSRVDGAVFGYPGRRYIVLNRGALSLWRSDPAGFRSVLQHEIGHVRNHDVDVMHATVALWRSFFWLIAMPAIVLFGRYLGTDRGDRLITAFHLVVLLGVLYQMRNGVLRARELYADADAHEHRGALIRLIVRGSLTRLSSRWARFRSPHPAPDYRALAIEQPHRLADLSVGDAFALGLVLMLAAPTLLFSISFVTQQSLVSLGVWKLADVELYPSFSAASLLLVIPVGAGVALGIWRMLHATSLDRKVVRVARIVTALGAGMLLGDALASSRSNLGPGLLLSGDAGWRWRGLLIGMTLLISVTLALTAALWPRPSPGWPGVAAAIAIAAYGSLLFCVYVPALLSARYPQARSESAQDLLVYAGTQVRQLLSWMPQWVTPGRLALVVASVPISGLTMTVARRTRTRHRQRAAGRAGLGR